MTKKPTVLSDSLPANKVVAYLKLLYLSDYYVVWSCPYFPSNSCNNINYPHGLVNKEDLDD